MVYPDDTNGDALRRTEAKGDDLTRPRNFDFTIVFAGESSTEQFAKHFRALGHEVSVKETGTEQDFPWDVVVVQHMVPSYDGINNFENLLQSVADGWGGRNDGWGCLWAILSCVWRRMRWCLRTALSTTGKWPKNMGICEIDVRLRFS